MNLEIRKLNLNFDSKKILTDINFEIMGAGIVSVIGPNGSGKTSLLRCISGACREFRGDVFFDGLNLRKISQKELSDYIGLMHQEFFSIFDYSVSEILRMGRYIQQGEGKYSFEEVVQTLELEKLLNSSINGISTGEKQLTQAGMLLYQSPKIYLLDEPVSHLDPYYQKKIIELILKLKAEGHIVIVVFHDIKAALNTCDSIIVLNHGQIEFSGIPETLLNTKILEKVFRIPLNF